MLARFVTTRNLSPGDQFLTEAQYDMKKSVTGDLRQSYLALPQRDPANVDIADFLGLTTQTISRTFTPPRKSKIIAIDNNHTVIIQRPTALNGLARGDAR